jgi:hypothetical protein
MNSTRRSHPSEPTSPPSTQQIPRLMVPQSSLPYRVVTYFSLTGRYKHFEAICRLLLQVSNHFTLLFFLHSYAEYMVPQRQKAWIELLFCFLPKEKGSWELLKTGIIRKGVTSVKHPFLIEGALRSEIPLTLKTEDTVESIVHLWWLTFWRIRSTKDWAQGTEWQREREREHRRVIWTASPAGRVKTLKKACLCSAMFWKTKTHSRFLLQFSLGPFLRWN